jgi:hypothetical protein
MKSVTETATLSRLMGFVIALAAIFLAPSPAAAQFDTRSDGSDGLIDAADFAAGAPGVSGNTLTIDLGQATTAVWNTPGTGAGVYDPAQWFVVFKYQSVTIPSGKTLGFKNHPSNPPVVWLVQGAVIINGSIALNGGGEDLAYPVGGPGGFRGGRWSTYTTLGFGPGAVLNSSDPNLVASTGYLNNGCFPLVGGSGAMPFFPWGHRGGGGGGAILIAAGTSVSVWGNISASEGPSSYASGGMVRLVAQTIEGSGNVRVGERGLGRIRIEASNITLVPTSPMYSSGPLGTQIKFLRDDLTPAVRVVSVGGVAAPADPQARFELPGEVVVATRSVQAVIECRNVPTNSTVKVYFRSASNGGTHTVVNATLQSGNQALSTWVATGDLGAPAGYSTVQAHVILPAP